MQMVVMQSMLRACPLGSRQYKRGDGSFEPVATMMVSGNYIEPFIGPAGTPCMAIYWVIHW